MFLSLNPQKIFESYPRSVEVLKLWFKMKSMVGMEDTEEIKKQLDEAINDQYLEQVLQYNPRLLYDFFDDKNIRCFVTPDGLGPNTWEWFPQSSANRSEFATTRQAAELQAFTEGFIILESKQQSISESNQKDEDELRSEDNGVGDEEGDN